MQRDLTFTIAKLLDLLLRDLFSSVVRLTLSWNFNTNRNAGKSLFMCGKQLAGGLLLKKLNYFEITLNNFVLSRIWKNVESWLAFLANKLFWIAQPYLSTWYNKTKLVPAFFPLFLRLLMKKIKFNRYNFSIL